jgi:ribose transport system permease protein
VSAPASPPPRPQARSPRRALLGLAATYGGLGLVLIGLVLAFGLASSRFVSTSTFVTLANQTPDAVIIAVGMTLVLIAGEIDLSVGSVLALSGAVLGVCLVKLHLPLAVAVAACLAVGVACGLVSGLVVTRFQVPSFIVTLGMLEATRGMAYLVTSSQTQYIGAPVEAVAEATLFGLSLPFLLALLVVAAAQVLLGRTVFGRYLVAVGTNEEATRLAGIDTRKVKLAVFMLSGLAAAAASVIHCARLASADPNAGTGYELSAIAAVVIGGTSLLGGRGSVISSFFGVAIISVLGAGLAQVGAEEPQKRLVTGCVIVAAVILDQIRTRRAR